MGCNGICFPFSSGSVSRWSSRMFPVDLQQETLRDPASAKDLKHPAALQCRLIKVSTPSCSSHGETFLIPCYGCHSFEGVYVTACSFVVLSVAAWGRCCRGRVSSGKLLICKAYFNFHCQSVHCVRQKWKVVDHGRSYLKLALLPAFCRVSRGITPEDDTPCSYFNVTKRVSACDKIAKKGVIRGMRGSHRSVRKTALYTTSSAPALVGSPGCHIPRL